MNKFKNSQGKIWYGMHFYPGVAEYQEPNKEAYRIFLNENTLRQMDPTFAGCPVFVEHVEKVPESEKELKDDADGWVIESFFNEADGKHWVKFITVSQKSEDAILRKGYRLSNSYFPKKLAKGGTWNGVAFANQVEEGQYDHLALVENPRYAESVIMTPEQFKKYNEDKIVELKKLSNSKDKKEKAKMSRLQFWKKEKIENDLDIENTMVQLPTSKVELSIFEIVSAMDKVANMDGYANLDHMVKLHDGSEMKVSDLLAKHKSMNDEMAKMKQEKETELATKEKEVESDSSKANDEEEESEEHKKNDEEEEDKEKKKAENDDEEMGDEEAKKKALEIAEHEEGEMAAKKKNELEKKRVAKEKADKVRNAHLTNLVNEESELKIEFAADQVSRGKARYGSN